MSLLTYAMDGSQALVHVDDVPKGLKCGCFCPHCGAKLYTLLTNTVLTVKELTNHQCIVSQRRSCKAQGA